MNYNRKIRPKQADFLFLKQWVINFITIDYPFRVV